MIHRRFLFLFPLFSSFFTGDESDVPSGCRKQLHYLPFFLLKTKQSHLWRNFISDLVINVREKQLISTGNLDNHSP